MVQDRLTSWICCTLAIQPWAYYLIFLNYYFFMFIMETSHPSQPFSGIGNHLCEESRNIVYFPWNMICIETDDLVCMECSESRRLRERLVCRQFTWEEITGSRSEGAWWAGLGRKQRKRRVCLESMRAPFSLGPLQTQTTFPIYPSA